MKIKLIKLASKLAGILFVAISVFTLSSASAHASCKSNFSECKKSCGLKQHNSSDCQWVVEMKPSSIGGMCPEGMQIPGDCANSSGTSIGGNDPICYWPDKPDDRLVNSSRDECDEAVAWCSCSNCDAGSIPNPLDPNCEGGRDSLGYILGRIIVFLPVIVGLVLLAMIVMGGIKIATAGENEEQKKKGIQTITNALIGVGVVVAAVIIISIVEAILNVQILYGFTM